MKRYRISFTRSGATPAQTIIDAADRAGAEKKFRYFFGRKKYKISAIVLLPSTDPKQEANDE
jgi:hypothetical protein